MDDNLSDTTEYTQKITTTTTTIENTIKIKNDEPKISEESSPTPTYLYVLSDNVGYVGTYYSISDIEEITSAYYLVTFMVQCFKVSKKSGLFDVWVVLYKDIDAVAYVSNNKNDASKVHATLMQMGIAYIDSIDYWKQRVGLSPQAKHRLDLIHSIKDKKILDDSYNILIHKLDLSTEKLPDEPIQNFINETQKISIMDCIIPTIINKNSSDEDNSDEDNSDENNSAESNSAEDNNDEDNNDEDNNDEDKNAESNNAENNEYEFIKNVPKKSEFKFCEKCQLFADNLFKSYLDDTSKGNELLMAFIGKHCYLCMNEIRNKWRKGKQQIIKNQINLPIDSPYISTSINNKSNDNVDKLSEVIQNLGNLLNPSGEECKNLDIEKQLSNDSGSDSDVEDIIT